MEKRSRTAPARGSGSEADFNDTLLVQVGFTALESRIYCDLLRNGPGSGYRLARRLDKAPASVYQTLQGLQEKGAIVRSEGFEEAPIYGATPAKQLLDAMQRRYTDTHCSILDELSHIEKKTSSEKVYSISSVNVLLERVRAMLASATTIILFDFFPVIYDLLRSEIDEARARGVTVAGIAYEKRHEEAAMPLNLASFDLVSRRWPGLGLLLVVDGREKLIALISSDMTSVLNAIWTDSVFLSCVFHSALAADIRLVAFRTDASDPLRSLTLQASEPPGLRTLLEQSPA